MGNDNNLPALVEATGLAEFEGWTFEDTSKWLADVARQFGKVRLTVGLGLWVLRDRGTEEDYGAEVRKLADLYEVDEGTLRRWRSKAQAHFVLGAPAGAKARSEGQTRGKRSGSRPSSRNVRELRGRDSNDTGGHEPGPNSPSPAIDATATEQPNAEQQPTEDAEPTSPPAPSVDKPEQLSLFDDLFAHKPTEVATAIPSAEGLAVARKLRKWVDDFESAVKGITPLSTPAGESQPAEPVAPNLGEQAKAFLRLVEATPAQNHSARRWKEFNGDFVTQLYEIISAKTGDSK